MPSSFQEIEEHKEQVKNLFNAMKENRAKLVKLIYSTVISNNENVQKLVIANREGNKAKLERLMRKLMNGVLKSDNAEVQKLVNAIKDNKEELEELLPELGLLIVELETDEHIKKATFLECLDLILELCRKQRVMTE
jgi:hypothetical protein